MLKQNFIIALLLLAFAVVLAHSIIPHQHSDNKLEISIQDEKHEGENSLEHSFEHYSHADNTTDYFIKNPNNSFLSQIVYDIYEPTSFQFKSKEIQICFVNSKHTINNFFKSSESLHYHGLRGPPLV